MLRGLQLLRDAGVDGEIIDDISATTYVDPDGTHHLDDNCAAHNAAVHTTALTSLLDGSIKECLVCFTTWQVRSSFSTSQNMLLRHVLERASICSRESRWLHGCSWQELAARGGVAWLHGQRAWAEKNDNYGTAVDELLDVLTKTERLLAQFSKPEALARWAAWISPHLDPKAVAETWFTETSSSGPKIVGQPAKIASQHVSTTGLLVVDRAIGAAGPGQLSLTCHIGCTALVANADIAHAAQTAVAPWGWNVEYSECEHPQEKRMLVERLTPTMGLEKAIQTADAVG